jgi:hypothetical protein
MQKASQTIAVTAALLMLAILLFIVASPLQPVRLLWLQRQGLAEAESGTSVGQMLYVPVYSHISYGGKRYGGKRAYQLAVTLSIRSTDPYKPILITAIRYYDTAGQLLQDYLAQPLRLGPLASTEIFVEEEDVRGGAGANFLVEWRAAEAVNAPLVEAVMVGTSGTQGMAFTSPSRVVSPHH